MNLEATFIARLESDPDPLPALRRFACQYHYFSLHQVVAFSQLLAVLPPQDRRSLADVATVLYDELGRGTASEAHSMLFERFAEAVGVPAGSLPLLDHQVFPGIRTYVQALKDSFSSALPRALAAYVFLEESAVETYGPLLAALRKHSVASLVFFELHAQEEPRHLEMAKQLLVRCEIEESHTDYTAQQSVLSKAWQHFWRDMLLGCWPEPQS